MPTITKITSTAPQILPRTKVAAYARVSDDTEMLLHSLSAQVSYYSALIQRNPAWEFVGVYADAGITGTSVVHRDEFIRLISDCEAGKIDLVLVKSISRFARDTVDCLNTTRHLKDLDVAVYFEREKINSISEEGELMLTLLASYAQEESRSISENIKWATRKRFEEGIPNGHKAPYGYRWDGEMFRIIPEQGEVVREIYRRYLAGESAYSIAKTLAERGVAGHSRAPIAQSTVMEILSNISYTGTMALQKNFISENHTRKRNKGELPMYLVDEMAEPLVSEEDYQRALEVRQQRADQLNKATPTRFSGKVRCGYCGCGVSRRTSGTRKRWVCNTRERKGMASCQSRPVWESELDAAASMVAQEPELITIFNDRIEFSLRNGARKSIAREYSGQRGQNAFTNKVWCGVCGCKCERDTCGGRKVWRCPQPRTACRMRHLPEGELLKSAADLLGDGFQAKFAAEVKWAVVFSDHIDFEYENGMVRTWQRE